MDISGRIVVITGGGGGIGRAMAAAFAAAGAGAVVVADIDGDGDLDLAIVHQNTPMELLENQSQRGNWLSLEFVGRQSNRRGIGVRVVVRKNDRILMQELAGGVGYCSSRQPRLTFGLGSDAAPCDIEIDWPGGGRQHLTQVSVNQLHQIIEPATPQQDLVH